jgi:Kef-type K+ transport system membrane component KefB
VSYTDRDTAHVLAALIVLLVSAHTCGYLFARFRQPPVIGEIVGGILLGPTLLERVWPSAYDWLFPSTGAVPAVLGAVYQLGLLLLMFTAGTQMRGLISRSSTRVVASVAVAGLVVPFLVGVAAFTAIDFTRFEGTAQNRTALLLVFAIAIAVTSIPVISRIMLDLGLLQTRFARIVLSVAVIEDVVLYVVLAVAIGIVAGTGSAQFGLAGQLGWDPGSTANYAYHTFATIGFLAVGLMFGPRLYAMALRSRYNVIKRRSQVAFQLVVVIAMSGACLLLSIVPLFGAFVAGIIVVTASGERAQTARFEIGNFSLGLFIPLYFAIVGLQLDLVDNFDVLFFVAFLLFACLVKSASVYAGARIGGEPRKSAVNLAMAMNARGGPGIVLASTAFAAGIINDSFYTTLVMLAIVTSLIAGTWLQRVMTAEPAPVHDSADALVTG